MTEDQKATFRKFNSIIRKISEVKEMLETHIPYVTEGHIDDLLEKSINELIELMGEYDA